MHPHPLKPGSDVPIPGYSLLLLVQENARLDVYKRQVDGSAYGIIKDYKCPQIGFVSTRSRLGNLFLTGQNLNVHGALGVTLTAMLTCAEFVGQEYLAKKVGNA